MNVFDAIKKRRSIRVYTNENISKQNIDQLIEAARWAPSAGNTQPLELVIVKNAEIKHKLSKAALNQSFIEEAPLVMVVCADITRSYRAYGNRGKNLYSIQDIAAAIENILLAAQELGLATCWVGAFQENEVSKTVRAPKNIKPLAIIPIGYPGEERRAPSRRAVEKIVHHETF